MFSRGELRYIIHSQYLGHFRKEVKPKCVNLILASMCRKNIKLKSSRTLFSVNYNLQDKHFYRHYITKYYIIPIKNYFYDVSQIFLLFSLKISLHKNNPKNSLLQNFIFQGIFT